MRYRRARTAGATYFFTVNLADRSRTLLVDHVDDLRASVRAVKSQHAFDILAWVVLPDHLHAIWTLPEGDSDFATRWMLIKSGFSRRIPAGERISPSRRQKGERGIWQRRYWEHLIRDESDLQRHIDYVHINPVKHGHVTRAADWKHSSIHRYIRAGWMTAGWAVEQDDGLVVGESR
jgi:putative transposase